MLVKFRTPSPGCRTIVLWVKGHTETTVAALAGLRRKQVSGIIGRSPFKNRSALSTQERQSQLNKLKEIRVKDGKTRCPGVLDRFVWTIEPLAKDQKK